jgi:hypothetical protein
MSDAFTDDEREAYARILRRVNDIMSERFREAEHLGDNRWSYFEHEACIHCVPHPVRELGPQVYVERRTYGERKKNSSRFPLGQTKLASTIADLVMRHFNSPKGD